MHASLSRETLRYPRHCPGFDMTKLAAIATVTLEEPAASTPLAGPPAAPVRGKQHQKVDYTVKLAPDEHAQLLSLRERCRAAGISAGKSTLLRAAVALLNEQSSFKLEAQLQQLSPLTAGDKKKTPK